MRSLSRYKSRQDHRLDNGNPVSHESYKGTHRKHLTACAWRSSIDCHAGSDPVERQRAGDQSGSVVWPPGHYENFFQFKLLPKLVLCAAACSLTLAAANRERLPMDSGWRFALGHASDQHKDFDTPRFCSLSPRPDTATVRYRRSRRPDLAPLDLPHDWAVELPFDAKGDGNHGFKAIGRTSETVSAGTARPSRSPRKIRPPHWDGLTACSGTRWSGKRVLSGHRAQRLQRFPLRHD